LLQTNSYIVPKDKRAEHARLVRRFRQTLHRLGCEHFEVYEQVGANWGAGEQTGRYVHIMRFRDRKHQLAVQAAERNDPGAQALINEFCELINFPYQQQQGLFAVGFYQSVLPIASPRSTAASTTPAATADASADTSAAPDEEPLEATTVGGDDVVSDEVAEATEASSDDAEMVEDDPASDEPTERQNA
jgi:hypothetical protein